MNKKYTVLPEPYYTDLDDDVRCYDLALSAGDVVTADLSRTDSQGDVYASPVVPNSPGDWINPECLEEVKDWQSYVPDGLTPIEGDEVIGKLFYQNDEVVKGIVIGVESAHRDVSLPAGVYVTVSEGPEGNIGDQRRFAHQTRILKSAQKEVTEGDVPLADWERELLSTEGKILLALTGDEVKAVSLGHSFKSIRDKAEALLPKPKMVTVELTEEEARNVISSVARNPDVEGHYLNRKIQQALKTL